MSEITFTEFRDGIRRRLWPSGEARSLRGAHDAMFNLGMVKLAEHCLRCQDKNVSVSPACSTFVDCGKTVLEAPPGIIKRVYTIANGKWCDRIYYSKASFGELDCVASQLIEDWVDPDNVGLPALQQGVKYADKSTDSPHGRARVGIWAIRNNRIYLYPWVQSNESVVIEWEGVQQVWRDTDIIDTEIWMTEHAEALKAFVQWHHEKDFGERQVARELKQEWLDAYADAIYEDKKLREQREAQIECVNPRCPTQNELADDAVPAEPGTQFRFAWISDYGKPTQPYVQQVADLVKSWNPVFIITSGDNVQDHASYETGVRPFYGDYISPVVSENRFWPCPGNHDYNDPTNGFADYLGFFSSLPGNQRYYDVVKGPVHFFFMNLSQSNPGDAAKDPDGKTSSSVQGQWLKVKLRLSTAKWKVVVFHNPPYTLGSDYPGFPEHRWNFKGWGADVVLSGHSHLYERYVVDGFPYVVNGMGGGDLIGVNADGAGLLTAYKQITYNTEHGASRCTASCTELKLEFINKSGTVIDTLTLEKA